MTDADALGPPPYTVASILGRVRSLQEDHAAGKGTGPTRIQSVLDLAISALEGRPWIIDMGPAKPDALDQLRDRVHHAEDPFDLFNAVRDYLATMGKNVEGLGQTGKPCPTGDADHE